MSELVDMFLPPLSQPDVTSSFSGEHRGSTLRVVNHVDFSDERKTPDIVGEDKDFLNDAIGSHSSTDALLAYELNQLSLKQRDEINEEVHGVRDAYLFKETPEFLNDSLQQLMIELKAIRHKPAYAKSQTYDKTWVNTDKFRLMFLRCDLFDAPKAAKRIVAFLEVAWKYFGDVALQRCLRLSDMGENGRKFVDAGFVQLLPERDRSGRRILGHFSGEVYNELNNRSHNFMKERIMNGLYFALKVVQNDIDTQKRGVVLLYWMHKIRTDDIHIRNFVHKTLIPALPCRINAVHCYVPAAGNQKLVHMTKTMFLLAIGSDLRSRIRIHTGSPMECLYALQTFGIQASQVPINSTTGKRKTNTHLRWMEQQILQEKLQSQNASYEGIDCPRHSDVLFGRGWAIRKHPGNALYRVVLEQYLDEYNKATDRGRKSTVASSVVSTLKESYGSRFLREDKNGGFWYEVSDDAAREKVSVGFRDMRKPKKSQDNNKRSGQDADSVTTSSSKRRCKEQSMVAKSSATLFLREDAIMTPNSNTHYAFIDRKMQQGFCLNLTGFCWDENSEGNSEENLSHQG